MNERVVGVRESVRRGAGRAAIVVACAGLLLASGCSEDADQAAVHDASIKLASLSAGAGAPLPDGTAESGYREVISMLQGVAGDDEALAADAAVLTSAAQRGLATREASRALVLERMMLSRMPVIRAALEAWSMHSSAASAAAAYDPSEEFARIDRDVRARQDEAEQQRAEKARIEAEVADLLSQVSTRLTQASQLRAQAGEIRLRIPRVSATEGLALTEQIRGLTRQADALELEAAALKTEADAMGVDLHAAEVAIDKLESQIELMAESRASVQTRQAAAQARAAAARGDAQEAAALIAQLIDTATGPVPPPLTEIIEAAGQDLQGNPEDWFGEGPAALTPFVNQTFEPKIESAAGQFRTAASTAGRARSARREAASLATGQAQQGLGEVEWAHSRGMNAYAQLLEELAAASPALPSSAEYASRASAARDAAEEAQLAAYQAYEAAVSAYESAGGGDEIEALRARLNGVLQQVGDGVVDAEALRALEQDATTDSDAGDVAPGDSGTDEPGESGDPAASLRAEIERVEAAANSGDFEPMIAFLHPVNEQDAAMVDMLAPVFRAVGRLDAATESAFGQSFTAWAEQGGGESPISSVGALQLDLDSVDLRVNGDEAIALPSSPDVPETRFQRIDGEWKLLVDMESQLADNPMADMATQMMEAMLPAMADAMREATQAVEGGELGSNEAVEQFISEKVAAAMGMPGGG